LTYEQITATYASESIKSRIQLDEFSHPWGQVGFFVVRRAYEFISCFTEFNSWVVGWWTRTQLL